MVFGDGFYKSKPIGTVTIFQDDTRISTNVMDEHNHRAIGTRVSAEVYEQVVEKGQRWHDRAFVVTHWYKTAYEPIRDIEGKIIGILYVGTLETPFSDSAREILLLFMVVLLLASGLAIAFAYILAGSISAVLSKQLDAMHKLAHGDLGHEVETDSSIEELNSLAESFNEMSQRLHLRETSLKINQEKLEAMNKSYLDLLGFVAHELKGLLASAVMNAYSLRDGFLGMINFKQKRAVDSICRNLDYLTATVGKFLNLSRIERGNLEVHKTEFLLNKDVFDYSIKTFSKLIEDKKIKITNSIDPALKISADRDLMQIVANNLINNAAKYGTKEGQILVRSSLEGTRVKVEVYNDGRPIGEDMADQLFKKFSRLDVPERRTVKGTGLGLYITKQIVESHGGIIYVEPKENGNSFIFEIERE